MSSGEYSLCEKEQDSGKNDNNNPSSLKSKVAINWSTSFEFLNLISKLKHLDRTGWVKSKVTKPESVAGHMYRMAVMSAFIIEDPTIDITKCIKMSIVHDMGESIIGDITPHCGVSDETKREKEEAAVKKLSSLISPVKGKEIYDLFIEYEEGKTAEARLVKDLDKFDMILQAYEYEELENKPRFLQDFFNSTQNTFNDSHPYVKELVQNLRETRDKNKQL